MWTGVRGHTHTVAVFEAPQDVQNRGASSSHTTTILSAETYSAHPTRRVLKVLVGRGPTTSVSIPILPDTFDSSSTNTVPNTTACGDKLDCVCIFIPSALIPQVAQDWPNSPSGRIVTQPRELEKDHHTTSRILKAPVRGAHSTPAPLPTRPGAARLLRSSVQDDNPERPFALPHEPNQTAPRSQPVLPLPSELKAICNSGDGIVSQVQLTLITVKANLPLVCGRWSAYANNVTHEIYGGIPVVACHILSLLVPFTYSSLSLIWDILTLPTRVVGPPLRQGSRRLSLGCSQQDTICDATVLAPPPRSDTFSSEPSVLGPWSPLPQCTRFVASVLPTVQQ